MLDSHSLSKALVLAGVGLASVVVAWKYLWPTQKNKRIWLIRHGHAEHNKLFEEGKRAEGTKILDPTLTAKGFAQALEFSPVLKTALGNSRGKQAELIVCSPLRRTLQTCTTMLGDFMSHNPHIPVILHPDIQEASEGLHDSAHPKETILAEFLNDFPSKVDSSLLTSKSHKKEGRYKATRENLKERYNDFLRWLAQREEMRIIVVAHHNVFLFLSGISFLNCEAREFELLEQEPVPCLLPRNPRRSRSDEELDQKSLDHLRIFEGYTRKKQKRWGMKFPDRLR